MASSSVKRKREAAGDASFAEDGRAAADLGLDEEMADAVGGTLRLTSREGEAVEVDRAHARVSGLVRGALELESDVADVPVMDVGTDVLGLVVRYMEHHRGREPPPVEKPLKSNNLAEVVSDRFDADFMAGVYGRGGIRLVYELMLAANYLDIPSLLHLGAAKVAAVAMEADLSDVERVLDPSAE